MKKYLLLCIPLTALFLLRISHLSIRISDSSIYFYTAYSMLHGQILYKDIFFTNFPLFPYISMFYLFISGNNILFYYFTPTIEISIITVIVYHLIFTNTKNQMIAILASCLYVGSFMVLSTSEYQTGVFLASLFSLIAYFFWGKKKFFLTGVFLACAFLTKAYFIPIVVSFFIYYLFSKQSKQFFITGLGFFIATFCILLPSLLLAPSFLYKDIISYSLTRGAGVSKEDILWFFITKDFVFFILLLFNLGNFKKQPFFSCISFFSILFFIFYNDPYYLYFNFLAPFLSLSFPFFYQYVEKTFHPQKMVLPTCVALFLLYTGISYFTSYRNLGTFSNIQDVVTSIQKEDTLYLYGVNDTTPILSFLTNKKLLDNIVDTNTNIFRKGLLNAKSLTNDAVKQKALVIVHGVSYPEYGINELAMDEIVDKKILLSHCKLVISHPIYTEGLTNRLNIFSCK